VDLPGSGYGKMVVCCEGGNEPWISTKFLDWVVT